MKIALCGGDLRSVFLARRFLRDGHEVRCFALETADVPKSCHTDTMEAAFNGADCIILPTPAFKQERLTTPFGSRMLSTEDVLCALPKYVPVFGGSLSESLLQQCAARRICITDLLSIEALAIKNAALTAECALQVILWEIPYTLAKEPVLILGAGRIGKLLGLKLQALGAQVTVTSRKEEDNAWCRALGFRTTTAEQVTPLLPQCRLVVNTIPARVLSDSQLQLLPKDALLFELASKPGGFPPQQEAPTVIGCGGLPGKYAPQSAADLIAETIYHRLEC